MLSKEEYLNLVDVLADEDKFDEYVWNFVYPGDNLSCADVEKARDYIVENLKELIEVHFDNPPLKFEELKPNMWVWDSKFKIKLLIAYCYSKDDMAYYNFSNPEDYKYIHIDFEENRFYRYEVKEDE